MTQAAAARSGLAHAAFLERLSAESSGKAPDSRLAQAAFLALRLVDLLGPDADAVHPDAFHYQYLATDRLCRQLPVDRTETGHVAGLLRGALDAFDGRDVRLAAPALFAYAHYLEDELRLAEALDVLETLVEAGGDRLSPADAIAAQLRIGRVNRKLNRFDQGERAYVAAAGLAQAAADVHSALLSHVGRALLTQARGNLAEAERAFHDIAAEARAVNQREIEAHAEHALGATLLLRGKVVEGIPHVWRAFGLYDDESPRLRALGDLGVMLLTIGEVAGAEHALLQVVRRGNAMQDVVSNAMIELMHCASYRRDRLSFERWREDCESRTARMPPNILADFYLKAGIGRARFGQFDRAEALVRTAVKIAEDARLNELVFRGERIKNGLRDCRHELSTDVRAAAESVRSHESVREISASLAQLGTSVSQ